jgi:biopolymer transport protein ExbB/TolQ
LVGDLVGLLGGGVVSVVVAFASLVVWYARAERADSGVTEDRLRTQMDRIEADHRTERTRLQTVIDAERARRREAEDETARLRLMVRELGGDPG